MIDLITIVEPAAYSRLVTNSGSTLNHQDPCEKDTFDQLAHIANPSSTISHI